MRNTFKTILNTCLVCFGCKGLQVDLRLPHSRCSLGLRGLCLRVEGCTLEQFKNEDRSFVVWGAAYVVDVRNIAYLDRALETEPQTRAKERSEGDAERTPLGILNKLRVAL